jgi:phospholipid transport system substrate-binding protein
LYYRRVNLMAATGVVCASMLLQMALTAWATSPAEAVVRGAIASMKALPATAGEPAAQRKVLNSIDNALALDLLAKQALGPQWDKLSKTEQHRFVDVFTRSLEKIGFPPAAATLSQVKVNYLGSSNQGSEEVVRTAIANEGGGQMPIDFHLIRRGSRWQIVDAVADGMSLSGAISTRIQNAVTSEGYQKMLEELQTQVSAADPSP